MRSDWSRILGIAGIAALALSAWLFAMNWYVVANGLQAEGTVARVQLDSMYGGGRGGSSIMYYAFIRFQTESGEGVEFRSNASNKPLYHQGEQVMVLYDPDAPEKAQINSFGVIWATPVFAAVVGLGLIGFAIGLWSGSNRVTLKAPWR